jgi:uncharacterized protein (TIGR02217 family)
MANIFDDVRLPIDVERGAVGGPTFSTTVITLFNGAEQRNAEWGADRARFNIGYGISKRSDMEAVYAFFHARWGRARGFRFRNWLDYTVTEGPVAEITGEPTKRQLVRSYDDTVNPYIRTITRPVASTLRVYVNHVLTEDYTLDAMGVISFLSDPGVDVMATFEFDIPVRFDEDDLRVQLNTFNEGLIPSINIIELREE